MERNDPWGQEGQVPRLGERPGTGYKKEKEKKNKEKMGAPSTSIAAEVLITTKRDKILYTHE